MARREKNRAKDREFHYTYLIRDNLHNKVYYGVHSTDFDPNSISDYHGSSKKLNLLIKEFGIENFTKTVRRFFNSREEADKWEIKVLTRLKKLPCWSDFYNMAVGGEGFTASGFVSVRSIKDPSKCLKVPVDDEFIGVLYEYNTKGAVMTEDAKRHLSNMYKGTRIGLDNPVHKIKDRDSWRKAISTGIQGNKLKQEQKDFLSNKVKNDNHLLRSELTEEGKQRIDNLIKINNAQWKSVYIYKGVLYLSQVDIPHRSSNDLYPVIRLEETYPEVSTIVAEGLEFKDIKTGCKSLGLSPSAMTNRVKSVIWEDYYFLDLQECLKERERVNSLFISELKIKYKYELDLSLTPKPHPQALTDEELYNRLVVNCGHKEGSVFKRIASVGGYPRCSVTCPVCSVDKYVLNGIIPPDLEVRLSSLLHGYIPCRCGGLDHNRDTRELIYTFLVEETCKKEKLVFLGWVTEFKGKKTKLSYTCSFGNSHKTTSVGSFLDKRVRCRCKL